MSEQKHAAEVLADQTAAAADAYDLHGVARAAAMLRTIPALEAECDALRTDFRRLNEKHTNLHMNADACRKERDALRAEVESLRADAERWRFVRAQHEGDDGESICVFAPVGANGGSIEPIGSLPGELDAAIDAARTAATGGKA